MTEKHVPTWSIRRLHAVEDAQIEGLADVLIDCVEGGASVSFMLPLTRDRAVAFWRRVAQSVAAGERALLVAEDEQGLCGTVQLIFEMPENQPHRADLAKMLVQRRARRQGLGAALMKAAEETARQSGKTLLVLDAVTNGDAARLYERLGWARVGDVPNFALMPRGEPCSTTYYYRNLANPVPATPLATSSATQAMVADLHVRNATEVDLPAIVDINQSIPAGWSTADTQPIAVADRVEWFRKFDPAKRPIWVAEVDGQVVAMSYLTSFYGGRPAYDATAEASIYVATASQRRGIGRRFKQWVIEQCPRLGVTTLLSMHFDHNEGTRRINESLGFEQLGHLTEIAMVQGHKRGLVIWALRIPAKNSNSPLSERTRSGAFMSGINLAEKLDTFTEHWHPKTVGQFNGHDLMVVKVNGEFVWHKHDDTDDFFLVLKGRLTIQLRAGNVVLGPGELFVVPKGIEHCPIAEEEAHLLLIERAGTPNTGDAATATPRTII